MKGYIMSNQRQRELTKEELHLVLSEMLQTLANYCEENGIRYHLVGGTLLGAVRHQGFIPWDDDIDVGMPRPDYEKFLKLTKIKPISSDLEVISERDMKYSLPVTEVSHKRIEIERPTKDITVEKYQLNALCIDIFPQDGWPEDKKEALALIKKMNRYRRAIYFSRLKLGTGSNVLRVLVKIPVILLCRAIGAKYIINKMTKIAQKHSYDESKYVGAVTHGIYGFGERCLREEVVQWKQLEFEGNLYRVPGCYDTYLKGIYGNYMELPPQETRVGHRSRAWWLS